MPPFLRPPKDWRWPALVLLAAVAFFLWKRLPAPDVDDLCFLGAPLHMVKTGELVNPLLRGWTVGFGTDRYFLQMPLHPNLLAGWLAVFGVSAASVLGFSWAGYAVGALGLGTWLRRFGWSMADVLWLLPIYLTLMFWLGQRPDVTAFALLFTGLGLLDPRRAGAWGRGTVGFVLVGASSLCYPMTLFWAGPLLAADAWRASSEDNLPLTATLRRWLPALTLAVVLVAGLFVGLVHGQVQEFLRVFLAHRALRATAPGTSLVKSLLAGNKESLVLPVFLFYAVLTAWVAWRRELPVRVRALVLGTAAAALVGIGVYYALTARVGVLLGFFISAMAMVGTLPAGPRRTLVRVGLYGLLGFTGALWFVQTAFQHPPDARMLAEDHARWDAAAPGRNLFVDAAAARYLFDYRLPPGAFDLFYSVPPPGTMSSYVPGQRDVLWAANRPWLRYVPGIPQTFKDYPKHTVRGRPLETLPRDPFDIVVVADR